MMVPLLQMRAMRFYDHGGSAAATDTAISDTLLAEKGFPSESCRRNASRRCLPDGTLETHSNKKTKHKRGHHNHKKNSRNTCFTFTQISFASILAINQ